MQKYSYLPTQYMVSIAFLDEDIFEEVTSRMNSILSEFDWDDISHTDKRMPNFGAALRAFDIVKSFIRSKNSNK